ncbi:hypothetical protein [Streptosporangium sp. CA-115845]
MFGDLPGRQFGGCDEMEDRSPRGLRDRPEDDIEIFSRRLVSHLTGVHV